MKKEFMNQGNYDYTKVEIVELSHLAEPITEPGQAYTVPQILDMYQKNIPIELGMAGQFIWDSDGFNPEEVGRMDKIDRERFSRETILNAQEQKKSAQKAASEAEKASKEAKAKRIAEKRKKLEEEILLKAGVKPANAGEGIKPEPAK